MKYSLILPILLLVLFGACKKYENLQTSVIRVNTIVCDQCAETIKKAVFTLQGVKDFEADLDTKTIEVKYLSTQTNLETIEITIVRAGYDANDRKRDPEAYENLPECCKHQN